MRILSRAEQVAAWLCGAGILLGVGGFWAMHHVPMTREEQENERLLQEVSIPAARETARANPDEPHFQVILENLEKASVRHRPPPYREQGIIALWTGIAAFAVGSILWFGSSGPWRPSRWVMTNEDV